MKKKWSNEKKAYSCNMFFCFINHLILQFNYYIDTIFDDFKFS